MKEAAEKLKLKFFGGFDTESSSKADLKSKHLKQNLNQNNYLPQAGLKSKNYVCRGALIHRKK